MLTNKSYLTILLTVLSSPIALGAQHSTASQAGTHQYIQYPGNEQTSHDKYHSQAPAASEKLMPQNLNTQAEQFFSQLKKDLEDIEKTKELKEQHRKMAKKLLNCLK